jgi:predicted phage baseplate assembly protein
VTATSACGCCAGLAERTPLSVQNRPGLSAIAYRIGTHADFRASMIAALSDPEKTRLAELSTRDPGDFAIALLDAWAVAADVLTFYTERLAQESYLRTARDRISLQELGRLIGYRLRPGVAAETHVAFALEPPPAAPPQFRDPGALPPVIPEAVTLETGLRIQSIPGPGERPQTFETVEEIDARPEWNAVPASTTVAFVPGLGAQHAYLQGVPNLKPGDALLLKRADVLAEGWDLRTLTRVLPEPSDDPELARTRVEWAEPLGSFNPLVHPDASEVYVLRKRLNVFGHNAPLWRSMSDDFRSDYWDSEQPQPGDWPLYDLSRAEGFAVDLDGSQPDVVAGSWVVLSKPTYRELWRVQSATELSRAEFAVSGKVTRLVLEDGENYDFFETPRETTVFAVSEPLALAGAPDPSPVEGESIDVETDVSLLPKGRTLIVAGVTTTGEKHAETAVLASVVKTTRGWRLDLEEGLQESYERASVVVHANVALATHGETVKQLLGSGRAGASFQRFEFAQGPLTYVQSRGASGVDSALEVRVNEVRWDEVQTLFAAGPKDRAYVTGTDADGKAYVESGDGTRGSRLPSGSNNVRARYRKGLGAGGNVKAGALAQLLDRPLGVKGASNPLQAAGGVDPEPESEARTSIPLAVRTLGRAVSLLDYADFARAFAGVSKAHAAVLPLRTGRTVVVTVALEGDPGPEAAARLEDLAGALRSHGDPRVEVVVVQGHEEKVRLALRVGVDSAHESAAVLAKVASALETDYSREVREFVEPLFKSEIVATAHRVDGVVAVDVDELYTATQPGPDRLLARQPSVGPGGVAVSAGLLKLDESPFDSLEPMT